MPKSDQNQSDHEQFIDAIADLKKITIKKQQHIVHKANIPTLDHYDTEDKVSASEYLSYKTAGIQTKIFSKLKKGQHRPLATSDLHGKTKSEATIAIINFIANCQINSMKYCLIVHGKGTNNHHNTYPVLKNHIANLLKNNTEVLAFCSAKPEDGGTGALYLLLKRKSHE
jgi:DNA-nicking Smr family endonuclease